VDAQIYLPIIGTFNSGLLSQSPGTIDFESSDINISKQKFTHKILFVGPGLRDLGQNKPLIKSLVWKIWNREYELQKCLYVIESCLTTPTITFNTIRKHSCSMKRRNFRSQSEISREDLKFFLTSKLLKK